MIRGISLALVGLVVALAASSAQAATPLKGPKGKSYSKVLVIGTDGTRWDLLKQQMDQGKAPNLRKLLRDGVGGPTLLPYSPPKAFTLSEVGWSTIAAGVGPDKHGIDGSKFNMDPGQSTKNGFLDFLTRAERQRSSLSTFLASDWANIGLHKNGGPIFSDAIDTKYALDAADTLEAYDKGDAAVAKESARYLRRGNPDAGFVYFGFVDETAHIVGSAQPAYRTSITTTDARIGRVLRAIRARPTYALERWTVIVTTDHGQRNLNFGTPASHIGGTTLEQTSFVIAAGPGIPKRANKNPGVVDINPTVEHQLGITVRRAWNLDGRSLVRGKLLPAPPKVGVVLRLRNGEPTLSLVARSRKGAPRIRSLRLKLARGMRLRRGVSGRADGRSRRVRVSRRALSVRVAGKGARRILVAARSRQLDVSPGLLRAVRRNRKVTLTATVAEVGGSPLARQLTVRARR